MLSSTMAMRRLLLLIWLLSTLLFGYQPLAGPARSPDIERKPPGFTDVYVYTDGIEAEVAHVWIGQRVGVPVVELTVRVRNNSAHTIQTALQGDLWYGTYRRPAIRYLTPPGPDDAGSVQLIAIGETSDPYRLTFVLPPDSRGDVMFVLGIDTGAHDPAVFVGGL